VKAWNPVFDFIDHAAAEKKPFFLWYAPFMPHTPHTPPDRLFQKYKAKGIESDHRGPLLRDGGVV
jgi:arylsulfatase A-like enzyme